MSFWTCSLDCSLTDVKRNAVLVSTLKRKDEKEREKKRKEKKIDKQTISVYNALEPRRIPP